MIKKKVLLLSNSEICYNPRLAKAADSFYEAGYEVDVFNPVVGVADRSVYEGFIKDKKWSIREFDISKRNFRSKVNWLLVSVLNKLFFSLYKKFGVKVGFQYIKNKGLMGFKKNKKKYDIIIIHLVDSLPFAVKLKEKYQNSTLIYDSQEYFTGQYSIADITNKNWVLTAEKQYIYSADIVIGTTNIMCNKIAEKYNLKTTPIRVRNLPYTAVKKESSDVVVPVKFVWHGMRIIFENRRGLHILLQAVAKTKANVEFYIQGLISSEERQKIESFAEENKIEDKIIIKSPAAPDKIVESLIGYDVGLIGELPEEENQLFTSSNKLFEFIAAGLAIIMSDVPGLRETSEEYESYDLYSPGNIDELALRIESLVANRDRLREMMKTSQKLSESEIVWNNDFKQILALT